MIERRLLYEELVRQCTASRNDRFTFYQGLRNYYLFGGQDQKGAPYNKIASTVETLSSFIYSPDTLKFSLHLGTEASKDEVYKAIPLAEEVTEQWRSSKVHIIFGLGVRWSLVYGAMLIKILWNNSRVRGYLVEPHQFGVLREDVMDLADQEAFTHHYTITRTQLEKNLEGNPRKASILAKVGRSDQDTLPPLSTGLSRLLIGGPVGGVPGTVAIPGAMSSFAAGVGRGHNYDYSPTVDAELIDMCDLYVYNEEICDYQVVTRAAPDVVIYDRASHSMAHVKGLAPFEVIRPEFNAYDYFWGNAFIARLTWLQDWRSERIMQIKGILGKQFDPPMWATGAVGITDEKFAAMRSAGGRISFPTPNAKLTVEKVDMPADVFAEVSQIDAMFDDQAGLGHVLQGKGEPGVRSKGQADLMARLGSARPKERALAIEESAEAVAGNILRQVQDHSDQRFQYVTPGDAEPKTFIAEQFTRDYEVQVDGHSSSPIFIEDRKHDAVTLLEGKAINRARFLKMFDIPDLQVALSELKVMEEAELKAHQEELKAGIQPKAGGKHK